MGNLPRLDISSVGGVVSIDYLGDKDPSLCTGISVYGDRNFRKTTLEALKEQGYMPRNMPPWLGKHYVGHPTVSHGSLKKGISHVEKLDSKFGLQMDPEKAGIGYGILLEVQQYAGVEKPVPVAVLTQLWSD